VKTRLWSDYSITLPEFLYSKLGKLSAMLDYGHLCKPQNTLGSQVLYMNIFRNYKTI
jgi:hypothetical protein